MKILILTDLEGISGIDSFEMIQKTSPDFYYCRERLMMDLNAAVCGACDGGATEVYVIDGHNGSTSFIDEMLDPRAVKIKCPIRKFLDNNDICFEGAMHVGCHAMAGTMNGFLDHTQSSMTWHNYYVNGRKTGEIGQFAMEAAHYNIPVVLVTGDTAACAEAKDFLGDIECVSVKQGIGRNRAKLIDNDEALEMIRAAACRSIKLIGNTKLFKPILPAEIRLELNRSDYCDEIANKEGVERIDARTVRKISNQYNDIYF